MHIDEPGLCPLGHAPQQIRGHLGDFSITPLEGQPFLQCTACSIAVREAYRQDRDHFLTRSFREPKYLEDLTGITELLSMADDELMVVVMSDEELEDDELLVELNSMQVKEESSESGVHSAME